MEMGISGTRGRALGCAAIAGSSSALGGSGAPGVFSRIVVVRRAFALHRCDDVRTRKYLRIKRHVRDFVGIDAAHAGFGQLLSEFAWSVLIRRKPSLGQPRPIEQPPEIQAAAIAKQRHDRVPRPHVARDLNGGGHVDARRAADV